MPTELHVPDCLILPFGPAVKSDLQKIGLSAVSADGLYFKTDVPVVFIRKSDHKPLALGEFEEVFSWEGGAPTYDSTDEDVLAYMCKVIKSYNPNMTGSEELFIDLYFEILTAFQGALASGSKLYKLAIREFWELGDYKSKTDVWRALMPIPELQLYVQDPLAKNKTYQPDNNFRVDYGFWDGEKLIAVEIDGAEPAGYARDIRRDRLLRRAGVDVIHILNVELERHKERALLKLIPSRFFGHGWDYEGFRPLFF